MMRLRWLLRRFRHREQPMWVDGPPVPGQHGLKLKLPDGIQLDDMVIAALDSRAFELVDGQWREVL